METENETELYKGFDLSDYDDEDKARAVIDFLDLKGDEDTLEQNDDYFTVNPRKVKRGTSPKEYEEVIRAFKALLTPKQRELINGYLKLLGVLEFCECGKVKEKLYHKIKVALEEKQKKKMSTSDYANLELCKKQSVHIENILYHLLWLPGENSWEKETPDYVLAYREAWFGQPVKDRRKYSSEDSGEYRVLTDDEADRAFDDCMDDYLWVEAVKAKQTTMGYDDWCEWVKDSDGRGPTLGGYDGCEEEVDVDGTTYYIYRTN